MGRSPFDTEHTTWIDSPELTGPSPNEKGTIFGSTEILFNDKFKTVLLLDYDKVSPNQPS